MTGMLIFIVLALVAAAAAVAVTRTRVTLGLVASAPLAAMAIWTAFAAESDVLEGTPLTGSIGWLPTLGVSFDIHVDALSLVFLGLISTIGAAIAVYSAAYLTDLAKARRFLALLALFAAAMTGLVAVDNIYGLFVFWELTTITSYLLIGFEDRKGSARAAALQAVLTTGIGGLALLGGLVLLSQETATTSISQLVANPPTGTVGTVAIALILIGAFTKSAQVPFHSWLPGAMSAPTPASAYLHSATMVKAGIFLLFRLSPGFSTDPIWTPVVVTVGLITMVIGAWRALRQTDLKLLLAYSTVSQLGFITALTGTGSPAMLHAGLAVLVAHALFKSALFLTTGSIDAIAGTRDIRVLSGLGRRRPTLAAVGVLAAASMAGVPPLLGFVTKEAAFSALIDTGQWAALAVVAIASVATVAYSLRYLWGAFATKPPSPEADPKGFDAPVAPMGLVLPPLVLGVAGAVTGLFPGLVNRFVSAFQPGKLPLIPGWKPALAVSAVVVAAGVLVHWHRDRVGRTQDRVGSLTRRLPSGDRAYRGAVALLNRVADRTTGLVQSGSLPVYLSTILVATVSVPAVAWFSSGSSVDLHPLSVSVGEIALAALVITAAVAVTRAPSRMVAVLLLGAVGYAIAGIFVIYAAPDLALTLLLVETITVAIFAFVLTKVPRRFEQERSRFFGRFRAVLALGVGGFVTAASIIASRQRSGMGNSEIYAELAPAAGGSN
ncbi:MAG: DUF4040 domain-containing protein, partial [Acidimicrobiia bacterium]|nr:DUF4040 domain-containing protein [Acidimicrobiia bacterium]